MYLCTCVCACVCACFFLLCAQGSMLQDQLTNYSSTCCPIISLRATEAEQELAAGNSDARAELHEEHGRPSALGLSQESHSERGGHSGGESWRNIYAHSGVKLIKLILAIFLRRHRRQNFYLQFERELQNFDFTHRVEFVSHGEYFSACEFESHGRLPRTLSNKVTELHYGKHRVLSF